MSAVTPTIKSGGSPMPPEYELLSIDIRSEVNRVSQAEIRLLDGDSAKQVFPTSNARFFQPGAMVEISLRYEGGPNTQLFNGLVVRHGIESGPSGATLVIGLKDETVKLTGIRKSAVYADKTDKEIFEALLTAAGLQPGMIDVTAVKHTRMVQYDCTPWDFILTRAEALGMLVISKSDELSVLKIMDPAKNPPLKFTWGIDQILEFEMEADATHPFQAVEGLGWNSTLNALVNPSVQSEPAPPPAPGNLDPAMMAMAVGRDKCTLVTAVPVAQGELAAWAKGHANRGRLSMLRGRIAIEGRGGIKLLDSLGIEGVGERFSVASLVTGIRHRYDASGWRTDLQFGLSPELYARREDVASLPAGGLLPPIRGLQLGIVAAFDTDVSKELRVQVILPGIDALPTSLVWARLACPDAGPGRGFQFRPEMNDEVVVGFLNDDPRHPIILGSLFGSKNPRPIAFGPLAAPNEQKGIVTRGGTTISFVDAPAPSVTIKTKMENMIVISDAEGGSILLQDQRGSKITLDSKGITIDAGTGSVTIKGAKVDVA